MKKKKHSPEFYFELGMMQLDTALKLLSEQRGKDLPKWLDNYLCASLDIAILYLQSYRADTIEDGVRDILNVIRILEIFNDKKSWEDGCFVFADLDKYIKTREIKSIYNKKGTARC